jgi:hypothetical protein
MAGPSIERRHLIRDVFAFLVVFVTLFQFGFVFRSTSGGVVGESPLATALRDGKEPKTFQMKLATEGSKMQKKDSLSKISNNKYFPAEQQDDLERPILDPLAPNYPNPWKTLKLERRVEFLGILIDAGRHYFEIDWMHRLIDFLPHLGFNLIHLRLTDDQAFAVRLDSHPEMAVSSSSNSKHQVYTPTELRALVAYAKERGIVVIPEINVPGHAGSWGALTLQCPQFICQKGYGMSLNVTHPQLRLVLKDILEEILDIFDHPPFLHLGGDEVHMSAPCLKEVGIADRGEYFAKFEIMLRDILLELKFPEERALRWEAPSTITASGMPAGGMTHYWQGVAQQKRPMNTTTAPFFTSRGLYMDTNKYDWGWDIYKHVQYLLGNEKRLPTGITVGTFELNATFWYDRNVVSRLVAVALGASDLYLEGDYDDHMATRKFNKIFRQTCLELGLERPLCWKNGRILKTDFEKRWKATWTEWKYMLCERFGGSRNATSINTPHQY